MAMLHLRVICPATAAEQVVTELHRHVGVINIQHAGDTSSGCQVRADLPREVGDEVLSALHELDVDMIAMQPLDTAIGSLVDEAEKAAPGRVPTR